MASGGGRSPGGPQSKRGRTARRRASQLLRPSDPGYGVVSETERRLTLLRDRPVLICWGMRDFVFDEHFLRQWQEYFPAAEVHRYEDAGHYVLEDAGDEVGLRVDEFLARTQ